MHEYINKCVCVLVDVNYIALASNSIALINKVRLLLFFFHFLSFVKINYIALTLAMHALPKRENCAYYFDCVENILV